MNKPESNLYKKLSSILKPCPIELKRVENSMDTGTPDVFYTSVNADGWIELKYIESLPAKDTTKIKIPFRAGQYAWVRRRLKLNDKTSNFLIVQIGEVTFIFYNYAIKEEYTRKELLSLSRYSGILHSSHSTSVYDALDI